MPKSLGLNIVIGAAVGSALKSIDLVTNSTKVLGTAIEKLNSKKVTILENIDKEFSAKLQPIEDKLQNFYKKQKDIKLKIKVKDEEIKELNKKLKNTQKEINSLEKEKLNLEKEFKKGKISADEFKTKTEEIERKLNKLQKKKLGLDNKLQITTKKSTMLNSSLKSVNKIIDKLKNKKLKLKEELESAKQKAIETNKELIKIGKAIESINKRKIKIEANLEKREKLKSKMLDTLALGATIVAPFKAGIEFESEMARVKALSGATGEEFKRLQETAKKLGSTTVFSASEAAKGMQFLAMAGFKTNEIVKAMPGLLDLAAAGQTDLATTADITSNILSGFGISADKTTHVADVLAKAMTTANVDIRMLGETMKYVGPAASSLGASLEDVTTLTALLGNAGIQASNAGTALRSMYLRMASPPTEALKVIKQLGIQTKDANGNFIGMTNIIKQLQEKTKGLGNAKIAEIMQKLFGTEAVSAAMVLLKEPVKKINEYEKALTDADGTAKKIAKTQTDTVAGSFKALGSAVEGLSISFSALFLPVIKKATDGITWLTQKMNSFVEEHKTLATIMGGAVAGFGALTVASFVLGYAGTFVANAFHKSILVFTLLKNATLLLTTAEGRATLQTKLLSFWSGILNTKAKLVTFSKKSWAIATNLLSKSIRFLGTSLKFVGKSLLFVGSKLKTAGIYAYNIALKTLNFTAKLTSNALKFAGRSLLWLGRVMLTNPIGIAITAIAAGAYLIYSNWNKLKGFFSTLWGEIKNIFASALEFIKKVFSWSPLQTISSIWSKLANWFSGFWENIKNGFKSGVNTITSIFLHPINTIQKYWSKLINWISSKISFITNIVSKVKGFFSKIFGGDKKEKKLTLKPVVEKVKPIVTATAIATTTATAAPQIQPTINPKVINPVVSPIVTPKVINPSIQPITQISTIKATTIKPIEAVKPISVPVNTQTQTVKNTQTTPQTIVNKHIVYNFNFGDIKVETKDGKIANPEELKEELKRIIEEINFENKQRSLGDVV